MFEMNKGSSVKIKIFRCVESEYIFIYEELAPIHLKPLTGSLSLSGMLSMDILEPGLDSDSLSSLDRRSVS